MTNEEMRPTQVGHERSAPMATFIDYKRVLMSLTNDLRRLHEFAGELNLKESAVLIDEVLERLENDSFTVAVVGEFKRGKSTFINALLGGTVLPMDVLPCSATLNRVSYGLTPRVLVRYKDGREEEVPPDQLADYVTKLTDQSELLSATVEEATVYYPSPYCRNNVDVIDTPGLNDSEVMTSVTLSVLPKIDAAIMVILGQAPFSEYERDFLENRLLTADLGRVVFVVNGIDNFNRPQDAQRAVQGIERRIQQQVMDRAKEQFGAGSPEYESYVKKIGRPRVFGVSAFQALEAKQSGDQALLERSGFAVFEIELQRFLTERRGAIRLQVPVNRALATCRDLLTALELRRNAISLQRDDFEQAYRNSERELEELKRRKANEMERIRTAADETRTTLAPLVDGLPNALTLAAGQAIDQAVIVGDDLKDTRKLKERLGKLVDTALCRQSEKQAATIELQINAALAAEMQRLAGFTNALGGLMEKINLNFGGVPVEEGVHGGGEVAAAAIAVLTGLGGVWSGYREAGGKGAAVGAAVSVGTAVAAGVALAIFSAPVSLPVVIGIGLASILPGKLAAAKLFRQEKIDRFRAGYKEGVLAELAQGLAKVNYKYQVYDQMSTAFEQLREAVRKEANAALDNAEKTLLDLRLRYERDVGLGDLERQRFTLIEQEARRISEASARLSKQLVDILEI